MSELILNRRVYFGVFINIYLNVHLCSVECVDCEHPCMPGSHRFQRSLLFVCWIQNRSVETTHFINEIKEKGTTGVNFSISFCLVKWWTKSVLFSPYPPVSDSPFLPPFLL